MFPKLSQEVGGIFWVSLIAGLAGLLVGKVFKNVGNFWKSRKILSAMPSPDENRLVLGVAGKLLRGCPWEIMHGWLMQKGPVVFIKIFNVNMVLVGSSEGAKRIFQTGQRHFDKDLELSFKPFMGILGTGLVTSHGAHWQQQRTALGHVLRFEMLENVANIAHTATLRLCQKLKAFKKDGTAIEMEEEFRRLTLQIIGEAFLSLDPEESDRVFPSLYLPLMEEGNRRTLRPWRMYLPTPTWFRNRNLLKQLDSYLLKLLKKRWEEKVEGKKGYNDLLDKRLSGIMERMEVWNSALQKQLCFEFKTFLLAGHETSAAMLTWTLFELSQHPDKLAKVVNEGKDALADESKLRECGEKQEYALCCLKESLRKYSVVPVVTRRAAVDEEIEGYKIPAGTYVAAHLSATHDREWQDPAEWRPERWLPGGEYDSFPDSIRPYKFLPFVVGPRNCLGQNFALLEARVVLNTLVQAFKFTPLDTKPVRSPLVIPTGPKGGMHMTVS